MKITTIIDTLPTLTVNYAPESYCPFPPPCHESWMPVAITGIICATILIIVLVGMSLYFVWKVKEMKAKKQAAVDKRTQDLEDREFEGHAKLLEKLLSFKESRTKTENVDKLNLEGCKAYEESLENELKKSNGEFLSNTGNGTEPTKK